eukprot:4250618-Pleurochrysis_carterae.AAC.1
MAKIDLVFLHIDARSKEDPHNPRRAFNLAEFVEGIVRLSVLRHKDPRNLGMPVSEALEEFLEKHVLNESAECAKPSCPCVISPFSAAAALCLAAGGILTAGTTQLGTW